MKRIVLTALAALTCACGEAEEADPRCEGLTAAWSCPRWYADTRERCVDGEYQQESCSADQWCLSVRPDAASPYEGTCVPQTWRGGGCETGGRSCEEGWLCWKNACYLDCSRSLDLDGACRVEGETCRSDGRPASPPRAICTTAQDRQ